jgi:hypothetical protein
MYARIPQFVTGRAAGTVTLFAPGDAGGVRRAEGGFRLDEIWSQIAFRPRGGKEEWAYGWVLKDDVGALQSRSTIDPGFSIIATAQADEPSPPAKQAEWSLGAPPPPPPAPEAGSSPTQTRSSATLGDLTVLYGPLFLAMILGMAAKTAVDCIDTASRRGTLVEHLRNGSIAILVSPIVFLGFLQAGELGASTQAFLVLWLLAFQNGFFWQTVLKRNVSGDKKG